jgi:protoporphyrinogen oxidase
VHDDTVKVGRIQNYSNWSPDMVPSPDCTCLGLEYFCTEGDELWTKSDEDLVALAKSELSTIGLASPESVVDAAVLRMPDAYPVYSDGFQERLITARRYLSRFENLQTIGRNGLHQYNNQDHSMLTAILAVKNLLEEQHDLWSVNADDQYHEELALDE